MSDFPTLRLKPNKETSLKRYHPWVFSGALALQPTGLTEGQIVRIEGTQGNFLGTGHFQIGSIAVRVFSFEEVTIDREFWRKKLATALSLRRRVGLIGEPEHDMFRWVHGEGDGLPGLIVDVYGAVAVIQCHSIGFYHLRQTLAELLMELLPEQLQAVYDKSSHSLPFQAKLDPEDGYLLGQSQPWIACEYGNRFQIDVEGGQKTGFFIDQRENRALLAQYAQGRSVLNTFCYTGGFSVTAMQGGATRVDSVDSSQAAMALTDANLALNFPGDERHTSHTADVFSFLKKIRGEYDLIVLDPPAFAKHRKVLKNALKGYRSLNQMAFEQIKPGGIVFTFSCSQVVSRDDFRRAVFTAAAISRREVRILHQLSQPTDHPINIYHPEGEYLKGLVLAVE